MLLLLRGHQRQVSGQILPAPVDSNMERKRLVSYNTGSQYCILRLSPFRPRETDYTSRDNRASRRRIS